MLKVFNLTVVCTLAMILRQCQLPQTVNGTLQVFKSVLVYLVYVAMSGLVTLQSELTITGAAGAPDVLGEVCE